nr:MAG TPA: hypothetical protein [Caudoviricetes sp.]
MSAPLYRDVYRKFFKLRETPESLNNQVFMET